MSTVALHGHPHTLADDVHESTGEDVFRCYQCGKCAAGCPLAAEMDYAPQQILRLLQLNMPDVESELLGSLAIWLCLTCEQCVTRCPQKVDLPRIMDDLRQRSRERGLVHPKARDILKFHEAFLSTVKQNGRLHEVGLIARYKLRSGHLLQDILVAPLLLRRGKLGLLPKSIKGKDAIRRMFERAAEQSGPRPQGSGSVQPPAPSLAVGPGTGNGGGEANMCCPEPSLAVGPGTGKGGGEANMCCPEPSLAVGPGTGDGGGEPNSRPSSSCAVGPGNSRGKDGAIQEGRP